MNILGGIKHESQSRKNRQNQIITSSNDDRHRIIHVKYCVETQKKIKKHMFRYRELVSETKLFFRFVSGAFLFERIVGENRKAASNICEYTMKK